MEETFQEPFNIETDDAVVEVIRHMKLSETEPTNLGTFRVGRSTGFNTSVCVLKLAPPSTFSFGPE